LTTDLNDDDRLAAMACVDGELAPAALAAFEARLAHEPALAAAVARERRLRARLQSAYAASLDEPVPGALLDLLALPAPAANEALPAPISDASRARLPHADRWRWTQWSAIAAALVLGIALGTFGPGTHSAGSSGDALALNVAPDGAITAQGALRDALEQRIAGTVLDPNSKVGVGLSFRDHAKQYCRTFTLDSSSSGIACRQPEGWVVAHLEHGRNARAGEAGAYRTAASALSPTLLQAIDAMREGDTLDAPAETAARARHWKP
jgi:hypothetical protein